MLNKCFIKHGVYSGYTYRAVNIKVLGDRKVHSAVVPSFPGYRYRFDHSTGQRSPCPDQWFLRSQQLLLMDWISLYQWYVSCFGWSRMIYIYGSSWIWLESVGPWLCLTTPSREKQN